MEEEEVEEELIKDAKRPLYKLKRNFSYFIILLLK